jgi:hypothetical protein
LSIADRRLEDWALQGPDMPLRARRKFLPDLKEDDLTSGVAETLLLNYIYPGFLPWEDWEGSF